MNASPRKTLFATLVAGTCAALWPTMSFAQTAPAASTATSTQNSATADQEPIQLSPFQVTTSKDKGYRATNSISGSRLDTAIKDIPMPIEVITEQFLKDTGSKDLRQSLRYSAGILLQSQNDYGTPGGAYQGPGGVNNAEGATANKSQSSVKIRGFVTEAVLRDGYLRQNATDSINIGRIEVVRGPAALLYGVGNFGGIVNYLPKTPQAKAASEVGVTVGTYSLKRVTLDTTGPLAQAWNFNYRLTGAWEDAADYTQYRKHKHNFLAPVLSFSPTKTTDVLIDFETGTAKDKGIGFQRVRSSVGPGPNNDQNEHAAFYTLPGTDPRTFRWSGPDTYLNNDSQNFRTQITQTITENLHLMVGYNHSKVTYDKRDIIGNLQGWTDQFANPDSAFANVPFIPAGPNGTSNLGLGNSTGLTRATLAYRWIGEDAEYIKKQLRAELVYKFNLFEGSANKWLRMENMIMVGHTELRSDNDQTTYQSAWDQANNNSWVTNYFNPGNLGPLRYGQKQANGTAELPFLKNTGALSTSWNQANYAVFQGKLLKDRVTIVSGGRRDRNETSTANMTYLGGNGTPSRARSATQKQTTYQNGVSIEIVPELSVYALKSEGLQPNFSGARDTDGKPLPATMAKSKEIGVKIDLFNGRVTGTISAFEIKRTNSPIFYWWAPTSNYGSRFNPNKDIVYQVNEFQPSSLGGPTWTNGAGQAALAQWNAGLAAGAIYQVGSNWYANASKATGAAFLDKVFDFTKSNGYSWPGWLYNTDANTNHSWDMRASGPDGNEYVLGADTSKGWDTQIMIQPNENLQFVLGYAHVARVVESAGKFSKSPYPQDRWAVWFFPNTDWGLTRVDTAKAYGNVNDSSTWNGLNWGQGLPMDDTPEHQFTAWANYAFTKGALKGLSVGVGGYYESPRLYLSGLTHGGGQQITDKNGEPVMLRTKSRMNVDLMVRYAFKLSDHDASVQLNVNNVLNDQKLYGFIYSAPTTARLEFLYKF